MYAEKGNHIITAANEHKASARHLQAVGKATAAGSPTCQCNRTAWLTSTCCGGDHRQDDPDHHHVTPTTKSA